MISIDLKNGETRGFSEWDSYDVGARFCVGRDGVRRFGKLLEEVKTARVYSSGRMVEKWKWFADGTFRRVEVER